MKRVLILGGTGEAAQLAAQVADMPEIQVISSLAGRTRHPIALVGDVRSGGFGGADGLADYLRSQSIDVLIDATHPFAAQISLNAVVAANICQIPHLMVIRPAWQQTPADRWIEVESTAAAATVLPDLLTSFARRVFLTIGRQELTAFAHLQDIWFLMRMIDPPQSAIPNGKLLLERGPFTLANERNLLVQYDIAAIVSKNSGGEATYAKIIAAQALKIPVVMVQRPAIPASAQVTTPEEALTWLLNHL